MGKHQITVLACAGMMVIGCSTRHNGTPLVHESHPDAKGAAEFMELERTANTSTVKVIQARRSSVGDGMFTGYALYQTAKVRRYKYFATLKEWEDPDGNAHYIIGFANRAHPDINKEFGGRYAPRDSDGDEIKFLSVKEMSILFEKPSGR